MGSQTENLWQNTTGRNIENRRPLLATKTQPGNERFIENSLAGERKFQLHQIGSEADNNTKCGQSGRPELIITYQYCNDIQLVASFLIIRVAFKAVFSETHFKFSFCLLTSKSEVFTAGLREGRGGRSCCQ